MKSSKVFRKAAELMHATPTIYFLGTIAEAGGGNREVGLMLAMSDFEYGDSIVRLTVTDRVMLLLLAAELAEDADRRERMAQVFTEAAETMVKLPDLSFFTVVLDAGGQLDDFFWFIREVVGTGVDLGALVGAGRGMLLLLAAEVALDQG